MTGLPPALASLPAYDDLFVGRGEEVSAVCRMLLAGPARLVTLTGPPGIGKTRLAVAVAAAYRAECSGAPLFVDLAPVRDAAAVPAELARAVGVRPSDEAGLLDRLVDTLGAQGPRLLVLDNCEHVLAGAAEVGRLLPACPGIRVLATSRERLRLTAEWEFPVPPLAMPAAADAHDLAALAANDSVALLLDRARRTNPRFALDGDNAAAIARACVELEGLPLALELAAARLKLLTPGELSFRLRRRLDLLSASARDVPVRQRALRAAIDWSYDLLAETERAVFRRLSVFVSAWTVDDAQAVCADSASDSDEAVVASVESLIEKNLVRRAVGNEQQTRFAMLASLREYAAERLDAAGEADRTRARHAAHFARLAVQLEAALGRLEERDWWLRAVHSQADLDVALAYCRAAGRREDALWVAAALGWYCYTRGDLGRGWAAVDETLRWATDAARTEDGDEPMVAAGTAAGLLAWATGRNDEAETLLRRALERAERGDDTRRASVACAFLGHVARSTGRFDESEAWHRAAADGFAALANPQGVAWARHDLGLLARDRGAVDEAVTELRASLRAFDDLDYRWAAACSRWGLATALCARGSMPEAAALLADALRIFDELADPRGVAQCFEALAEVAADLAGYECAAMLIGWAAAQRARLAAPPPEAERARIAAVELAVTERLGLATAERLRRRGRELRPGDAMRLAAAVAVGRVSADPDRPAPAALTRRERQVAALVASGRTNRQIGRLLGITEKTVEAHLHNAMSKLGAASRAEVAAWAARHDLQPADS